MITITRSLARRFRQCVRRAGIHRAPTGPQNRVCISTTASELRLRATSLEAAVEYRQAGKFEDDQIFLPLAALDDIEGRKDEPVTLERRGPHTALMSWQEGGIPQLIQHRCDQSPKKFSYPAMPESLAANLPQVWQALADAARVTDRDSSRYSLNCLQLCGALGQIVATDGRQALRQSGYEFGFQEDVLLPASSIVGWKELCSEDDSVAMGKVDKWLVLAVGPWVLHLRTEQGRFPTLNGLIRPLREAVASCEFSPRDAEFLVRALPRLPRDEETNGAVTLDLNGQLAVRAKSADQPRPTELLLSDSRTSGQPLRVAAGRHYLTQALALGFRSLFLFGDDVPALFDDGSRQYLWGLWDAKSAIATSDDSIRIESHELAESATSSVSPSTTGRRQSSVPRKRTNESAGSTVPASPVQACNVLAKNVEAANVQSDAAPHAPAPSAAVDAQQASAIDLALAFKESLRVLLARTDDLVRALKLQKKRETLVESTLASLKQLQSAA